MVPKRAGSVRSLQLHFGTKKEASANKTANRVRAHPLLKSPHEYLGVTMKKKNLTYRLLVATAFFFAVSSFSREAFSDVPTATRLGLGHYQRLLQILLSRYENVVSYAQVGLRQLGFRTLEFVVHL